MIGVEEKKYACEGGKVHTFSDVVHFASYYPTSGKIEVIKVRNPKFDEMKNLV